MKSLEEKIQVATKESLRYQDKYVVLKRELGETRDIINLYEGLLDKLTEQNKKLKDWIKTKKRAERGSQKLMTGTTVETQPDDAALMSKLTREEKSYLKNKNKPMSLN